MPARFDLATAADIRFGAGRVGEVPSALAGLGVRHVLVVTGAATSRADQVRRALAENAITSDAFAAGAEPTVELVREAVAVAIDGGHDGVLGYGGGSALDTAKAVAALASSGTDPLEHLEVTGAGRPLAGPGLPCVAVPTTAGTGSEVTRNAVLSSAGFKASLRSPFLLPRVALVDPELLIGLPRTVIASSGMDALSQLIEPFLSARSNPLTDALARDGLHRSARSLRRAWEQRLDDPRLRDDLAIASLFGGLCLANSGLGAVHGIAAAAGARLGAPHGAVCASVLAATVDVNLAALRERAPDHPALSRIAELATLLTGSPDARPADAVAWLAELTAALAVPGLARYGLDGARSAELVTAAQRASSMRANPIDLTDAEVGEILARSL